jgi:hypothetical protein
MVPASERHSQTSANEKPDRTSIFPDASTRTLGAALRVLSRALPVVLLAPFLDLYVPSPPAAPVRLVRPPPAAAPPEDEDGMLANQRTRK